MENNLKYIVYLTINLQNKKIYVGAHKTDSPSKFDGYIGNGVFISRPNTYERSKNQFQFDVKTYGVKSFKRILLNTFDTSEEALSVVKGIVNETFIRRKDTYNTTLPETITEVYQYGISGNFIKCWQSYEDVECYFNIPSGEIKNAVKTKKTSCGYL